MIAAVGFPLFTSLMNFLSSCLGKQVWAKCTPPWPWATHRIKGADQTSPGSRETTKHPHNISVTPNTPKIIHLIVWHSQNDKISTWTPLNSLALKGPDRSSLHVMLWCSCFDELYFRMTVKYFWTKLFGICSPRLQTWGGSSSGSRCVSITDEDTFTVIGHTCTPLPVSTYLLLHGCCFPGNQFRKLHQMLSLPSTFLPSSTLPLCPWILQNKPKQA